MEQSETKKNSSILGLVRRGLVALITGFQRRATVLESKQASAPQTSPQEIVSECLPRKQNYLFTRFAHKPNLLMRLMSYEDYYYSKVKLFRDVNGSDLITPSDWQLKGLPLVDELMQHALQETEQFTGKPECRPGCFHCCTSMHIVLAKAEIPGVIKGVEQTDPKTKQWLVAKASGAKSTETHNPCVMLKLGKCAIYEQRPLACRCYLGICESACKAFENSGNRAPASPLPFLIINAFQDYFPSTFNGGFEINSIMKRIYIQDKEANVADLTDGIVSPSHDDLFNFGNQPSEAGKKSVEDTPACGRCNGQFISRK